MSPMVPADLGYEGRPAPVRTARALTPPLYLVRDVRYGLTVLPRYSPRRSLRMTFE